MCLKKKVMTCFISRQKKSLIKGFLRSDIKEMAKTQSESDDPHGIEMAQALCEQKNWPLVPVSTCFHRCSVTNRSHM